MSEDSAKRRSPDIQPDRYEIRIQGILDPYWSEWLGCPNVTYTTGETILSCLLQDQTALHGLLAKIRDMNLKLISLTRLESDPNQNEAESKEEDWDDH